jgi:hypothetical protein
MQEYYIRKEGDEDSRGPFTLEQLSSLVEAGQVDRQTYYYDAVSEKWMEVQANADLVAALFPQKRKLTIRPKESIPTVNVAPKAGEEPITVEQMLAAAEGKTAETRGRRDLTGEEARAARWGMRAMSVAVLLGAAGMLVPNMAVLSSGDLRAILTEPLVVLGVLDAILALVLLLEVTAVYALVRIRMAVGLGFFGVYFLAAAPLDPQPLAAVVVGSAAVFVTTMLARLWQVALLGLIAMAGMGAFAYLMLD